MVEIKPKLKEFFQYPVISFTCLLAVLVTLAWWSKADISFMLPSAEIRRGQLWRLVTSVFPHIDFFHLAFNLYWVWVFGTCIERTFGHGNTALLLFLLAMGTSSWEFAFSQGGVGLSGVGYGLMGMLWVLSRNDERFKNSIDRNTVILFLGWFVVCIAISLGAPSLLVSKGDSIEIIIVITMGIVTFFPVLRKRFGKIIAVIFSLSISAIAASATGGNIGNIAHAAGLALGIITGFALTNPKRPKAVKAGMVIIVGFGLLGATLLRPLANQSKYGGYEERKWCYDALQSHQNSEAVWWCRDAAFYDLGNYHNLINLGIAYNRIDDKTRASFFFHEAREINPEAFDSTVKNKK